MTDAHQTEVTIRLIERWPNHEPRVSDPHYALFHLAKRRMKKAGLLKCNVVSDYHYGVIELHHQKVEFAHVNDIDLAKFNKAYGLDLDDEQFQEYVEQEGNLEPLCLPAGAFVMTGLGPQRVEDIGPKDRVLGPDGQYRPVVAAMRRRFDGEVVELGGTSLTGDHPVLTPRGWLPASLICVGDQVGQYVGVLGPEVFDMVAVEPQVLRSIIGSDMVDMVHPLLGRKGPAELLFHDEAMLEYLSPDVALPHEASDVALCVDDAAKEHAFGRGPWATRRFLERLHPAGVSAEPLLTRSLDAALDFDATPLAGDEHGVGTGRAFATGRGAGARARRILSAKRGRNKKLAAARHARLDDAGLAFHARWGAVKSVGRRKFSGHVYDITVAGCPAFISGNLVLHNCTLHHRGQEGVHSLPEPEWNVLRTSKDPKHVITALQNTEIGVQKDPNVPS